MSEIIPVVKVDKKHGVVFGFAVVSKMNGEDYYDTQGDHVPEDVVLAASINYMQSERIAKDMHQGSTDGQVVFAFPLTSDIAKALGIETETTGLLIGMKPSKEVFEKFENGEYKGFSIGGTAIPETQKDETA